MASSQVWVNVSVDCALSMSSALHQGAVLLLFFYQMAGLVVSRAQWRRIASSAQALVGIKTPLS